MGIGDRPPWVDDAPFKAEWMWKRIEREKAEFRELFRNSTQTNSAPPPLSLLDILELERALQNNPPKKITPSYRQTPVAKFTPPEHFILQFIGGPLNGTQSWRTPAQVKNLAPGRLWRELIPEQEFSESYAYLPTYIPPDQTPFAEGAQIVIMLFSQG